MKKILAVSGGVDSMVMFNLMQEQFPASDLIVTTFDHGTRESSQDDAKFVVRAAKDAGIRCVFGKAKLGANTSEEEARNKRYAFLREIAEREGGEIYTAHHLDDLIESVAINLARGTGSRGLAVLHTPGIHRPFIDGTFGGVWDKRKILEYASKNKIAFRQDPTNTSDLYLRNRLRKKLRSIEPEAKQEIFRLWQEQIILIDEIDETIDKIMPNDLRFSRDGFREIDEHVAVEILRSALLRANVPATRPQIREFYKAILNYETGKKFNLPNDRLVTMERKYFQLKIW